MLGLLHYFGRAELFADGAPVRGGETMNTTSQRHALGKKCLPCAAANARCRPCAFQFIPAESGDADRAHAVRGRCSY